MADLAMNERAWVLADRYIARADELQVTVRTLPSGARLIDAGIASPGSIAAGCMLAELCLGGLGHVDLMSLTLDEEIWSGVRVSTDHPAEACMASQYAGWAINPGRFFAMGSGPLRAHARVERELFGKLGYAEDAAHGVLVLEGRILPDDDVVAWIAAKARLESAVLTLAVAPTSSLAGGVQIAARVVETGLHKMDALGFDVTRVKSATGTAPIAPVAPDDLTAIGRTNDCILYGGQARFVVDADDDELESLAGRLPACASHDYGRPFSETFRRYDNDFYKIDPMLFSPAEVWVTSARTGRVFHGGRVNIDVLRTSLRGA
jgi:methenyltetrahydromethanopterin cyclohydrolase